MTIPTALAVPLAPVWPMLRLLKMLSPAHRAYEERQGTQDGKHASDYREGAYRLDVGLGLDVRSTNGLVLCRVSTHLMAVQVGVVGDSVGLGCRVGVHHRRER